MVSCRFCGAHEDVRAPRWEAECEILFGLILVSACQLAACSITTSPPEVRPVRGDTAGQLDLAATIARRSATVIDIRTLRIGRDESEGELNLEFAPENDFADRLASHVFKHPTAKSCHG